MATIDVSYAISESPDVLSISVVSSLVGTWRAFWKGQVF